MGQFKNQPGNQNREKDRHNKITLKADAMAMRPLSIC
jgi:hypothetical protein